MYLEKQPIISLCIATNGVIEWLFPTLDSIFNQNVSETLYEVIVANNGDNEEFDTIMNRYLNEHKNLVYNKNNSILFNNQLEAFKLGRGIFLKFINHRAIFLEGALSYMLDLIKKNLEKKPVIYFSNRILKTDEYFECNSFDMFVKTLGIYVSHTSGVGIWKDQFDRIKDNLIVNPISPHSCLLFSDRCNSQYIICNKKFSTEITYSEKNKGKYDFFKAFAVEEPAITLQLYIDGDIKKETLNSVLNGYKHFVASAYIRYFIKKQESSYIIDGFEDSMGVFYSKKEILEEVRRIRKNNFIISVKRMIKKMLFFRRK